MSGPEVGGPARPRVIVVGAGIIGLSIAWRLAQAGCPVGVFDRGEAGRSASWAAGGMLAAGIEIEPGEEGLWPLTRLSQQLWPDFARDLTAASGLDVGYRDEGTLGVALGRDDVEQLRFHFDLQCRLGVRLEWLTGTEVKRREPFVSPNAVAGVFSPDDHQVDNRAVVLALRKALLKSGAILHENDAVEAVDVDGGRVTGVMAGGRRHLADMVVVAAGAWSRDLPGLPDAVRPPVRPIRGQLLYLRMDANAPLVRHVVWPPKTYVIPRRDGRLLIGATTEERGFESAMTAGGVFGLLEGAWRSFPGIEDLVLEELVVGFRPGSRDDAPILGPTAIDGLVMATGHHRNGILLAPVTADAVSRFVLTGAVAEAIAPFTLDRFSRSKGTVS